VTNRFDPRPNTKPLIQQFVDESGAHELCSSGGHVPEVVVVQVERDSPGRLVVDGEIAAADAEVGGLSVAIRESPIPGDAAGETYSSWRLDLVGVSG
jgi:hypothetical protein